jgi:lysophospholipase L1-like esterase
MLAPMMLRTGQRAFFLFLILCSFSTARGELVLTNFGGTNLIKIMPIGDSITDDCVFNGAWRAYLQPLLEADGYPFTFVGRQASGATAPSFTKVNHEGYCGTVIAPPGVFAVHGYDTTNAYLLKIVADALAVANNRPDLVLLLVGANDIGRGRDPWVVATNDMPKLLDLIFSTAPNANIVLAKITSLQNANISGLNYAAYTTNVPIYNLALQSMVNQRRAKGENVFLADMFSAVDYSTMFLSDHVHPSPLGLSAMAQEWLARIQAITLRTNQAVSTLIHGGDVWRYSDTGQDLGTNWTQLNYDDTSWGEDLARFGYGDPALNTIVGSGPATTNRYITTCFRRKFVVPWNFVFTNLNFRLARADGVAVWLNGQELFRTNLPRGPITYTNLALSPVNRYSAHVYYPTNISLDSLPSGTNLVAVEVHKSWPTYPLLGFDMELIGLGNLIPAPSLTVTGTSDNILLSWPLLYGNDFKLYSSANMGTASDWTMVASPWRTNNGEIVVTLSPDNGTRFFRLQTP